MNRNFNELLIDKRKKDKYQKALNDVISNAGTKFNCKPDSFYLLQELVDKNLTSEIIEGLNENANKESDYEAGRQVNL